MKRAYIDWKPSATSQRLVSIAEGICRDYASQGYDLTLRQLYYQFVARGHIPNTQRSYKNLGSVVDKARLSGLLDWSYIVDRTRNAYRTDGADTSPQDAIRSLADGYSTAWWDLQPTYVEVWVEKEALAGVIQRAADATRCVYFSCRGYVSQSEMHGAAQRFLRQTRAGKDTLLIHLGDHDPSGIDMSRDIQDRLALFGVGEGFTFDRIALNMAQVEQYNPPPNPAKITDSRFAEYQTIYGDESWELDALDPGVLNDLVSSRVQRVIDPDLWDEARDAQSVDVERLASVADNWDTIVRAGLDQDQ